MANNWTATAANDLLVKCKSGEENDLELVSQIPDSCIEAAEYVTQCNAYGAILEWAPGNERDPHLIATFGNGKTIDLSANESQETLAQGVGLTSYKFQGLPGIGEGVGFLWNGNNENPDGYNMHFGAVLAVGTDANGNNIIALTDMSEPTDDYGLVAIKLQVISKAEDFAGHDYSGKNFSMCMLTAAAG